MGEETTQESLLRILKEAWHNEYAYEIVNQKEAETYADSQHLKTLMEKLIEDSTRHRRLVGDVFNMIGGEEPALDFQNKLNFNFDRVTECELVQQIIWIEKKMADLYEKALVLISDKQEYDFIKPEDLPRLRESLTLLIRWERVHQQLGEDAFRKLCRNNDKMRR
ncbi:MAG: hypothetical protein AB9819_08005 [Methanomassiliicoccales archaeon]